MAARLGGSFHDGNTKHLSSSLIASTAGLEDRSVFERLTRREYALLCVAVGAGILGLLPLLLHFLGTRWIPGTRVRAQARREAPEPVASAR